VRDSAVSAVYKKENLRRFCVSIKKQLSNACSASIMTVRNVPPRAVQAHLLNTEIKEALALAIYKRGIKKPRTLIVLIDTRFFMNQKKTLSNYSTMFARSLQEGY
jgi:ribosomal protein L31E